MHQYSKFYGKVKLFNLHYILLFLIPHSGYIGLLNDTCTLDPCRSNIIFLNTTKEHTETTEVDKLFQTHYNFKHHTHISAYSRELAFVSPLQGI